MVLGDALERLSGHVVSFDFHTRCLSVRPSPGEMFPPVCNEVWGHRGNHRAKQWYGQYSAEWENDGADND